MRNSKEKPTVKERIYITLGQFDKNGGAKHLSEEYFEDEDVVSVDELNDIANPDDDDDKKVVRTKSEEFFDKLTADLIIFGGLATIIACIAGFFFLFFKATKWLLSD